MLLFLRRNALILLAGAWVLFSAVTAWLVFMPAGSKEADLRPAPATASVCKAIPPRENMPREAVAEQLESPDWRQRNAELETRLANVNRANVNMVFVGDSITQYWDAGLFKQFYGHRSPLNLGLWGDFTQGVLWRLGHDQWGNMHPRVAVVLIGTNNTQWGGTPDDVALGVAEILRFIHGRSPNTKILLLGVLPRGASKAEPLRATNAKLNELISHCADGKTVFYTDIGRILLDANGELSDQISFDRLHLTMVGYALIASAIEPIVKQLMGEN